jgi:hypothetical protein
MAVVAGSPRRVCPVADVSPAVVLENVQPTRLPPQFTKSERLCLDPSQSPGPGNLPCLA